MGKMVEMLDVLEAAELEPCLGPGKFRLVGHDDLVSCGCLRCLCRRAGELSSREPSRRSLTTVRVGPGGR